MWPLYLSFIPIHSSNTLIWHTSTRTLYQSFKYLVSVIWHTTWYHKRCKLTNNKIYDFPINMNAQCSQRWILLHLDKNGVAKVSIVINWRYVVIFLRFAFLKHHQYEVEKRHTILERHYVILVIFNKLIQSFTCQLID